MLCRVATRLHLLRPTEVKREVDVQSLVAFLNAYVSGLAVRPLLFDGFEGADGRDVEQE